MEIQARAHLSEVKGLTDAPDPQDQSIHVLKMKKLMLFLYKPLSGQAVCMDQPR